MSYDTDATKIPNMQKNTLYMDINRINFTDFPHKDSRRAQHLINTGHAWRESERASERARERERERELSLIHI